MGHPNGYTPPLGHTSIVIGHGAKNKQEESISTKKLFLSFEDDIIINVLLNYELDPNLHPSSQEEETF